jgi:hypothetical protein
VSDELRSHPDPDPTLLTTEQLLRAIASLRLESKGWVDALQLLLEAKIAGKDHYYDEKFTSIQTQFQERDIRTDQTASQVKLAVDAALQAQKEAAGEQAKSFSAATTKSETAMNRQIEGLDGKITDVKDRLNRVEAISVGVSANRSDHQQELALHQHSSQNQIAMFAAAIGAVGVLIALGGIFYTATRPAPLAPAVVYAQPGGVLQTEPKPQHQIFPLVPTWENGPLFHRIFEGGTD